MGEYKSNKDVIETDLTAPALVVLPFDVEDDEEDEQQNNTYDILQKRKLFICILKS